jgi:hypothetical protein
VLQILEGSGCRTLAVIMKQVRDRGVVVGNAASKFSATWKLFYARTVNSVNLISNNILKFMASMLKEIFNSNCARGALRYG